MKCIIPKVTITTTFITTRNNNDALDLYTTIKEALTQDFEFTMLLILTSIIVHCSLSNKNSQISGTRAGGG